MMNFSVGRSIRNFRALYRNLRDLAANGMPMARKWEMSQLRTQGRYSTDERLARWGYTIYSQHEEDGMLAEIFRRIGCGSRYFVELGVGDGLENNTLALLFQDWKGIWIEGNEQMCRSIRNGMPDTIKCGQLTVKQAFITRDNIDGLIKAGNPPEEIDLLSVDIDGNDFHVWERIKCVRPRVVVIEYNPKFPPPVDYCMQYDAGHSWDLSDHCGASLSFLERQFRARGYSLVACDITGTNAFFVRTDIAGTVFPGPFTAEFHYEPARFHLISLASGHPASYKTVERRVRLGDASNSCTGREGT